MSEVRASDTAFVGSIPQMYDDLLVPLFFEEPAISVATVIAGLEPATILETACGTGALTRELVARTSADITATDLNQPMLDAAQSRTPGHRVTWQVADALDLPVDADSFDVVTCQFGAMFFPDRVRGYAEARRVLTPGGTFVFTVWDDIAANAIADVATTALCAESGDHPLDFLARTPHGHAQHDVLRSELAAVGFDEIVIRDVDGTSRTTAEVGALAICRGTPLAGEIAKHPTMTDARAVELAVGALRERFGTGEFEAPMRWVEIVAR